MLLLQTAFAQWHHLVKEIKQIYSYQCIVGAEEGGIRGGHQLSFSLVLKEYQNLMSRLTWYLLSTDSHSPGEVAFRVCSICFSIASPSWLNNFLHLCKVSKNSKNVFDLVLQVTVSWWHRYKQIMPTNMPELFKRRMSHTEAREQYKAYNRNYSICTVVPSTNTMRLAWQDIISYVISHKAFLVI